ncbi:polymer-forming cytoskeletal protein [Cohnella sp. CFH 77786]|nr:polymer-forming cytoskeletal protein [Cohnella sp. CFH 77786]
MFKNKKFKIDPNMTDTLIGEGTHFEGKIKSEASIRIEGHLTGDIECTGDVTIGESGSARSHVRARNVILAGQVTGDVHASGTLTIKATGKLNGNLSARELSIEAGGVFQGTSKMENGGESAATEEQASSA